MSRPKGRVLPEDLLRRIGQTGLPFEDVILMLTVDEESWPHVAMLSHWQVFAADERTIYSLSKSRDIIASCRKKEI